MTTQPDPQRAEAPAAAGASDLDVEMRAYVARWYDAFPNADADAMADFYTEDARLYLSGLPGVRGRDAAARFLARMAGAVDMVIRHEVTDVERLGGDVALITGSAWVVSTPKAGGPPIKDASRFIMVVRREADGAWRCSYDASQHTPDVRA